MDLCANLKELEFKTQAVLKLSFSFKTIMQMDDCHIYCILSLWSKYLKPLTDEPQIYE